ncbi:MAG: diversity-generating retroelement protein Avd [Thermotogota bacterium]|nr:diversity-generating retroelement protein Avd [Thermotogota bacterium]
MLDDYKIYRCWYDFLNWTLKKVDTFPKSVRYTVSGRIVNLSLDILEEVIYCVYKKSRQVKMESINLKLDILRTFWRIALDNKWISVRNYEYICEQLNTFGKMTGGWLKSETSGQSLS